MQMPWSCAALPRFIRVLAVGEPLLYLRCPYAHMWVQGSVLLACWLHMLKCPGLGFQDPESVGIVYNFGSADWLSQFL